MSIIDPRFTYQAPDNQRAEDIRKAQEQAVRDHVWEHKKGQAIGESIAAVGRAFGPGIPAGFGVAQMSAERSFTRSEVLTVLRAEKAGASSPIGEAVIASLIHIFSRME